MFVCAPRIACSSDTASRDRFSMRRSWGQMFTRYHDCSRTYKHAPLYEQKQYRATVNVSLCNLCPFVCDPLELQYVCLTFRLIPPGSDTIHKVQKHYYSPPQGPFDAR